MAPSQVRVSPRVEDENASLTPGTCGDVSSCRDGNSGWFQATPDSLNASTLLTLFQMANDGKVWIIITLLDPI